MVQLDGLSLPVLREQMRAGRMPGLDRLVRHGEAKIDPWYALLPPVTPVSQAGILHGNNDDMPGFRWFEKRSKTLIVANTPDGASEIERRRSNGRGLLADDGASIGNLVTGDAARTYLTMATIEDDLPSVGRPQGPRASSSARSTTSGSLVLTLGEVAKEWYQRERQRSRGIEPRIHRDLHYALERALTNVALRNLTTALVIQEMFDEAPAIYVDYTGYDALAHHVGPERDEAVDALDGLDRTLGTLRRVARETHRPYKMVVLSDHGQCLGTPFSELYGELLEDVAKKLIGDTTDAADAARCVGVPRHLRDDPGRDRPRAAASGPQSRDAPPGGGSPGPATARPASLVACASGNLALLYLTCSEDRVAREEIDRRYPDLIPGLLAHPGVGLVVVHSDRSTGRWPSDVTGSSTWHPGGSSAATRVAIFGPRAADGLRRLDGFSNTGDLIVIGPYDPATGEVVSYEDLVGSHGGLGGWQGEPFLLHPSDLPVGDEPLVGAPAVHAQLRVWLDALKNGVAHPDDRPAAAGEEAVPAPKPCPRRPTPSMDTSRPSHPSHPSHRRRQRRRAGPAASPSARTPRPRSRRVDGPSSVPRGNRTATRVVSGTRPPALGRQPDEGEPDVAASPYARCPRARCVHRRGGGPVGQGRPRVGRPGDHGSRDPHHHGHGHRQDDGRARRRPRLSRRDGEPSDGQGSPRRRRPGDDRHHRRGQGARRRREGHPDDEREPEPPVRQRQHAQGRRLPDQRAGRDHRPRPRQGG